MTQAAPPSDKIQKIRLEIARQLDQQLPHHDPIFMSVIANDLLLADYLEQTRAMLHHSQNEAAATIQQATDQSIQAVKTLAESTVSQSAQYLAEETQKTYKILHEGFLNAIEQRLTTAHQILQEEKKQYKSLQTLGYAIFLGLGFVLGLFAHLFIR